MSKKKHARELKIKKISSWKKARFAKVCRSLKRRKSFVETKRPVLRKQNDLSLRKTKIISPNG